MRVTFLCNGVFLRSERGTFKQLEFLKVSPTREYFSMRNHIFERRLGFDIHLLGLVADSEHIAHC